MKAVCGKLLLTDLKDAFWNGYRNEHFLNRIFSFRCSTLKLLFFCRIEAKKDGIKFLSQSITRFFNVYLVKLCKFPLIMLCEDYFAMKSKADDCKSDFMLNSCQREIAR